MGNEIQLIDIITNDIVENIDNNILNSIIKAMSKKGFAPPIELYKGRGVLETLNGKSTLSIDNVPICVLNYTTSYPVFNQNNHGLSVMVEIELTIKDF